MPEPVLRCSVAWSDKSTLLSALLPGSDELIHDCHKAKGHSGEHQCACGKKRAQ